MGVTTTDLILWCVQKADRQIRCTTRAIVAMAGSWDEWRRTELRVDHDGEVFLTEVHADISKLNARSVELRRSLLADGWTEPLDAA